MRLGGSGSVMPARLAEPLHSRQPHAVPLRALRALQSIRRVAYITPASARNSSIEPISSEKASSPSRM